MQPLFLQKGSQDLLLRSAFFLHLLAKTGLKIGFLVSAMILTFSLSFATCSISPLSAPAVVHTGLQCGLFFRHAPTYTQHTIRTTSRQTCRDELGL